ncbi:hypothetical protein B0A67_00375 [Flavobacterium aquidurense]|uniref:Uncharacterized protein n=2 Tax=Flavobacterium TaxID=237 RepID=A0A0D0F9E3_9FLAO|nr:hypothetical protein IW18_01075 [Flavobacterium hibernum]OXA74279.1 hypothetical protein B0A67_00375 [Flavobacterium aquidurense]OXG00549.1 hypothetical protein B0A63_08495 [Flavobacterium johnsoniae UW101]RXM45494.1 hypothetical protein BOW57_05185 [Flavobacterium sp. YO64]RXM49541.1 hypothetical protein BOW55_00420 [Flavobacterium sp. YO12]
MENFLERFLILKKLPKIMTMIAARKMAVIPKKIMMAAAVINVGTSHAVVSQSVTEELLSLTNLTLKTSL